MHSDFSILSQVIRHRRTTKPPQMNGQRIPDAWIAELLQLAHWAPNHGGTEPWHFFVYSGESLTRFCMDHADLYRTHTPAEQYQDATYEKLLTMGTHASHLVVAAMRRGPLPKIPAWEEMAATAAAIQNLLLGATALGIASYWGTGGMVRHMAMKDYLGLGEHDMVMGALYLGMANQLPAGKRNKNWQQTVTWKS
jgi:nitroreductase